MANGRFVVSSLGADQVQDSAHFCDGFFHPHHHRPANNRVADIQFDHVRDSSDRSNVDVIQPVPCV